MCLLLNSIQQQMHACDIIIINTWSRPSCASTDFAHMDIKNTIYKQMLLQTQTPLLALLSVGNDCLYALQMSVSAEQFRKP